MIVDLIESNAGMLLLSCLQNVRAYRCFWSSDLQIQP